MDKIKIPKREEILKLLNGAKRIPFSPTYVSVDTRLETIIKREEFNHKGSFIPASDNIVTNNGSSITLMRRIPLKLAFIEIEIYKEYFISGIPINGDKKHAKELYESGFLEYAGKLPRNEMTIINEKFPKTPYFNAIYLFPTDICNLNCLYCNVENNMPSSHKKSLMQIETANKAIDLFISQLKSDEKLLNTIKPKYISFYGGEALVNKKVLNWSIEYASKALSKAGLSDKVDICVMTNGTLMDEEEAKFLGEHHVSITISFDGVSRHHDSMRVFPDGRGSFQQTLKGYEKIKKECEVMILSTVGNHNVNDLEEISHYFANELEPNAVEFSLVRNLKFGTNPASISSINEAFEKLYAAHKILIKKKIPDNNFSRRILTMANQYIYSHHLTRCGDVLYVSPNGELYTCDSFLGMNVNTELSVSSKINTIINDSQIQKWFNRHPFNMSACKDCAPISICGGGCPYNAEVTKGSLYETDEQICQVNKYFLGKLIKDIQHTCK